MATLTLTTPVRIGDLTTGFSIASLDLSSISINFQQATPIISIVLVDPVSKYPQPVTITGATAGPIWTAIRAAFPNFEKQILTLFASSLPPGTIS
jgi:hypothetical protein